MSTAVASTDPAIARMVVGDLSTMTGSARSPTRSTVPSTRSSTTPASRPPSRGARVLSVNALAPRDLTRALMPKFGSEAAVVTTASQADSCGSRTSPA
ncbi:hypothetical protein GS461_14975 [Rhodococcus hoagii]|nr:hypothetical protein [Prescottella equi]